MEMYYELPKFTIIQVQDDIVTSSYDNDIWGSGDEEDLTTIEEIN